MTIPIIARAVLVQINLLVALRSLLATCSSTSPRNIMPSPNPGTTAFRPGPA